MKIFLRTGAFYLSETKSLTDDLDLSELLNNPIAATPKETVVPVNYKNEIAALNERIDILTKSFNEEKSKWAFFENEPKKEIVVDDKPAEVTSKKMVTKKTVAKKVVKSAKKK